jgi:hypothetical protein
MPTPAQTYANHRALPSRTFIIATLILAVNVVWQGYAAWQAPGPASVFAVVVAATLLAVLVVGRRCAQIVQDRVIRLEMRVRLERLLPPERLADILRLTLPQLVALRFASDAELPALVQDALAQGLGNDAIKRKITAWQADWLRV